MRLHRLLLTYNRLLVLHPFLFTLFPILSLYSSNVADVHLMQVFRPAAWSLLGVSALLVAAYLLMRDWHRAGLLATLASLLFFNFGLVYRMLGDAGQRWSKLLFAAGMSLFFLGAWWVFRRAPTQGSGRQGDRPHTGGRQNGEELSHEHPLSKVTLLLNRVSALALVACLWGFAAYGVQAVRAQAVMLEGRAEGALAEVEETAAIPSTGPQQQPIGPVSTVVTPYRPPDIYYIILDGYGRDDVLEQIYGQDNGLFLDFLREKGFYLADKSHSNYPQTALSLASSLNFSYLDEKLTLNPEEENRMPLTTLIQENEVQRFLQNQGYYTVSFSNGFPITELQSADNVRQPEGTLSNFEISLLSGSMGAMEWNEEMQDNYRQRVRWMVDEVDKVVTETRVPKFVFVHLILPHPPFVFSSAGEERISLAGGDGSHFAGTTEQYVDGYRQQLLYTNALARRMIESILNNSEHQPVILLQGDHGPGSHLDWESRAESCLWERFSILNAYYLPEAPDGREPALYPSITPVNTFRVVLNTYFDAGLALVDDRAYYATWKKPYALEEVTGEVGKVCGTGYNTSRDRSKAVPR